MAVAWITGGYRCGEITRGEQKTAILRGESPNHILHHSIARTMPSCHRNEAKMYAVCPCGKHTRKLLVRMLRVMDTAKQQYAFISCWNIGRELFSRYCMHWPHS